MLKGRDEILAILVDNVIVMWVLHAGHDGARESTKHISLSLLIPGKGRINRDV